MRSLASRLPLLKRLLRKQESRISWKETAQAFLIFSLGLLKNMSMIVDTMRFTVLTVEGTASLTESFNFRLNFRAR